MYTFKLNCQHGIIEFVGLDFTMEHWGGLVKVLDAVFKKTFKHSELIKTQ